jgi:AhpD family alkylhydroperoxidase
MSTRVDMTRHVGPGMARALLTMGREAEKAGIEKSLHELVKIRASQLNGCAHCIDMHTKDARARGESEQRIYALSAWRETPFFTSRERAALEWTEALTRLGNLDGVPDDLYARVRQEFDEDGIVALSFAVAAINSWNRLAVAFHAPVGTYQPGAYEAA